MNGNIPPTLPVLIVYSKFQHVFVSGPPAVT